MKSVLVAGPRSLASGLARLGTVGFVDAALELTEQARPDVVYLAVITRLASETIELLRNHEPWFPALAPSDLALTLREGFYEPGYAEVTPAATSAVAFARELGVKLETTYTGRAFAALLADAADGTLVDADVVFWDTYNSAPMPAPGREDALPPVLREFVGACR